MSTLRGTESTAVPSEPLAVSALGLARMLSCSVRHIRRLDSMGRLPKAVTVGSRLKRWIVREIQDWLEAGSPSREDWDRTNRVRTDNGC